MGMGRRRLVEVEVKLLVKLLVGAGEMEMEGARWESCVVMDSAFGDGTRRLDSASGHGLGVGSEE